MASVDIKKAEPQAFLTCAVRPNEKSCPPGKVENRNTDQTVSIEKVTEKFVNEAVCEVAVTLAPSSMCRSINTGP